MTPELTALTLAGLLQAVQFALFAIPANLELGTGYTSSRPRHARRRAPLSTRTARLQRALNNHFEGLILFTLAVVVVTLGEPVHRLHRNLRPGPTLPPASSIFPPMPSAWRPWRSAIWAVGFFATVAMLIAALI